MTKHFTIGSRISSIDARVGQVRRIIDLDMLAVGRDDFVNDAGGGGDDVHVVLAPEPFLDDLHVQQAEKAAAKAEAERDGAFRLIDERGIVQLQLADRRLQMLEVAGVDRVNAAEDHRMDFLEAGQAVPAPDAADRSRCRRS